MFQTEEAMVGAFVELLSSGTTPWGVVRVVREFPYVRGRTDVVVTTEEITIAFEAKLTDWRRALDQAYRNTCFAEESYVLLPLGGVDRALKCLGEFRDRGVGLCCISKGNFSILQEPISRQPIEPWLTAQVRELALA